VSDRGRQLIQPVTTDYRPGSMQILPRRLEPLVALGLTAAAIGVTVPKWHAPIEWKPDSLFYQAQLLEVRGADAHDARRTVFFGPLGAARHDPRTVDNPAWIEYSSQFYRRRWVDAAVGAALYPLLGDATLYALSLAAFVLCAPALYFMLRRRWSTVSSAAVVLFALFLQPLQDWSFRPLTDSTGLLLEILAVTAAIVAVDRRGRWAGAWLATVAVLSLARDAAFVVVAGLGWAALAGRSRYVASLAAAGLAVALPALVLFGAPLRVALAYTLNGFQPPPHPTWGFIAHNYVDAAHSLIRNDINYVAKYPAVGVFALAGTALLYTVRARGDAAVSTLRAAALAAIAYVLLLPNYTEFRLELVALPMVAAGLAMGLDRALAAIPPQWSSRLQLRNDGAE
jgi:hypothetical protein